MPLKKKRSRSLQQIDEPFEPDEEYDIVDIDQVPGEITLNLLKILFQTILKFYEIVYHDLFYKINSKSDKYLLSHQDFV